MSTFEKFNNSIEIDDIEEVQLNFNSEFLEKNNTYAYNSALSLACNSGAIKSVLFLISKKSNIEFISNNGWRPLHWAAGNGHTEVVKILINKGADKEAETNKGFRPVHCAVIGNHVDSFRYLLSQNVSIKATTNHRDGNRSIFDIIKSNNYLECTIFYDLWIKYDSEIFKIIRQKDWVQLRDQFFKEKVTVKENQPEGLTALELAVDIKAYKCLNYMLSQDIDEDLVVDGLENVYKKLNIRRDVFRQQYRLYRSIIFDRPDDLYSTLIETINTEWPLTSEDFLEIAIKNRRITFVHYILPRIIKKEVTWDKYVRMANHLGLIDMANTIKTRADLMDNRAALKWCRMHIAISDNCPDVVLYLLQNYKEHGMLGDMFVDPSLCMAISLGHKLCAEVLIGCDLKIDCVDQTQRTPLHLAILNGMPDLAFQILNKLNDMNAVDIAGFTPLHLAAMKGWDEIFSNMVIKKGDPHIKLEIKPNTKMSSYIACHGKKVSLQKFETAATLYLKLHRKLPEIVMESSDGRLMSLIDFRDRNDGSSILHLGVKLLMAEFVEKIINKETQVGNRLVDLVNQRLETPLFNLIEMAKQENNVNEDYYAVLELLLRKGADVNARDINGICPIKNIINFNNRRALQVILRNMMTIEVDLDENHLIELYQRQWYDELKKIIELTLSPLMTKVLQLSIERKHIDCLQYFVDNIPDKLGKECCETVLQFAANSQNQDAFKIMLKFEIDEFKVKFEEEHLLTQLILHCDEIYSILFCENYVTGAFICKSNDRDQTPLYCAAQRGYLKLFKKLIMDCDDLDWSCDIDRPLEVLLRNHQNNIEVEKLEKILKLLVRSGVNLNNRCSNNTSLLDLITNAQLKRRLDNCYAKESFKRQKSMIVHEDKNICSVCLDHSVNSSIIPCGHVYCSNCLAQLRHCPCCRGEIKQIHKIYLTS